MQLPQRYSVTSAAAPAQRPRRVAKANALHLPMLPSTRPLRWLPTDVDDSGTEFTDEASVVPNAPAVEPKYSVTEEVALRRAASRLARGVTTCRTCQGKGTCTCPHCAGVGVLDARHAGLGPAVRGIVRSAKSALGLKVNWLETNRCMRCHGTGTLLCSVCSGSGLRYPQLINPVPQRK